MKTIFPVLGGCFMRLALLSVSLLTFAAATWVAVPVQEARSRVQPIGPQPTTTSEPQEPDLPPEPLDADDLASLNACANDSNMPAECRIASVRRLLTHYLRPPANPDRVAAVLKDTRWVTDAEITRLRGDDVTWLPGDLWGNRTFIVHPFMEKGDLWARLVVRVSSIRTPKTEDLRAFLRGEFTRTHILQIEELSWQDLYPKSMVDHFTRHRHNVYGTQSR